MCERYNMKDMDKTNSGCNGCKANARSGDTFIDATYVWAYGMTNATVTNSWDT